MPQTNFEVYAFDGSRWSVQQTFGGHQREAAIDCAKELYAQTHIKGVRVIQETYDESDGGSNEKTILTRTKSDDVPKNLNKEIKKPVAPPPKTKPEPPKPAFVASKPVPDAPVPRPAAAAPPAPKPAKVPAPAAPSSPYTPGRLAAAVGGSSVLAAIGSLLMMQMPHDAALLLTLKNALGANYLIPLAIAIFGFGLISSGLALLWSGAPQRASTPAVPEVKRASEAPVEPVAAAAPPPPPRFPVIPIEDDEPEPPAKTTDLDSEALRTIVFFHDCLAALPRDGAYMTEGRLDAFNWFGCHLFFAGLAEEEARRLGWDRLTRQRVIATGMKAALADPRNAARFAARYDDYLTEPRALAMFNRGQEASAQRQAHQPEAKDALRLALEHWNKRGSEARTGDHVCVMFTDIVGSTEFAQIHGDVKQYEAVQAHNRIVRTALQEYSGREIKHTGDGIMAAFDDGDLAARAALQIQREIAAHRAVNPEIGMDLRIGLAAGEPIREGSDLFGSTVQLAARACAFAQPGQVIASDAVKTVTAAVTVSFIDLGEQPLKGFKQPVRVHQVVEG